MKLLATFVLALALVISSFTSLSASLYPSNYELALKNGETIHIDGIIEMYAGGSKEWILAIQYDTDSLDDKPRLCERAELLWPHLQPLIEKKGWSWGSVRASKKTTSSILGFFKKTDSIAWAVGFQKVDGKWRIMNDECKTLQNK